MSLFKWSTPARKRAGRILPLIPNEIYLHIFEHIAPPSDPLTPEELSIFTKLSCVCRFFANYCLPRIFEYAEFSGSVFRHDATHKTSRESTLCTQIATKQPLALALAKTVRVCRFTHWKLGETGAWAVRLFANTYTAGLAHMQNLRELTFFKSFVDVQHWKAIAALHSLEKLVFDACEFVQGPAVQANVIGEPKKKIKVSHLQVTGCTGHCQAVVVMDVRYLRTLVVDITFSERVDWLSQSALTELHLCGEPAPIRNLPDWYIEQLPIILARAPPSLEVLTITFDDDWSKHPFLRSFVQHLWSSDRPEALLCSVLDATGRLTNLRSFTLQDNLITPEITPIEIRGILGDKLGPESRLRYVDMCGRVLRWVDGEWSEVPSSTA